MGLNAEVQAANLESDDINKKGDTFLLDLEKQWHETFTKIVVTKATNVFWKTNKKGCNASAAKI